MRQQFKHLTSAFFETFIAEGHGEATNVHCLVFGSLVAAAQAVHVILLYYCCYHLTIIYVTSLIQYLMYIIIIYSI